MQQIRQAVEPLKALAVERAKTVAKDVIERSIGTLDAHGWDVNKAAPQPKSTLSKNDYVAEKERRNLLIRITEPVWASTSYKGDYLVKRSLENEQKYIEQAAKDAALAYDDFVSKLSKKVGEVTDASLKVSGDVWGQSVLTVTKPDGTVQQWRTQVIVNTSKYGRMFYQYPTRLIK